jgi:hypothetical protein
MKMGTFEWKSEILVITLVIYDPITHHGYSVPHAPFFDGGLA